MPKTLTFNAVIHVTVTDDADVNTVARELEKLILKESSVIETVQVKDS